LFKHTNKSKNIRDILKKKAISVPNGSTDIVDLLFLN